MMRYCLSVDLGSMRDYTAFALIEKVDKVKDVGFSVIDRRETVDKKITIISELHLAYLERIPLKTAYHDVVEKIYRIMFRPEFVDNISLVVDRTGIGIPIIEMMYNRGLGPIGISIHGGENVTTGAGYYSVPKKDIVTALLSAIQMRRFKTKPPSKMPIIKTFKEELTGFQMKINKTTGHETYEAWTERVHDDLVMACAMGVWYMDKVNGTQTTIS